MAADPRDEARPCTVFSCPVCGSRIGMTIEWDQFGWGEIFVYNARPAENMHLELQLRRIVQGLRSRPLDGDEVAVIGHFVDLVARQSDLPGIVKAAKRAAAWVESYEQTIRKERQRAALARRQKREVA